MLKRFILIVSSFFVMILNCNVYAINDCELLIETPPENIIEYASDVSEQHFYNVSQDLKGYGMKETSLDNYGLGQYFSVYNIQNHKSSYFFTIVCGNNIEGLMMVNDDGELTSSLGKYFANELEELLNSNYNTQYKLVTDGNNIFALSSNNKKLLYSINPNNVTDISYKFDNISFNNEEKICYSDLVTVVKPLVTSNLIRGDVNRPLSYKTVEVKGVDQGNHPWCWAATCAALINYYKGNSLSASTVAKYIYPNSPEQGGSWTEMKKAYNHWGLYPSQSSRISFSSIKTNINNNKPMHLGLTNHSVGLIGYEDWEDRNMLILLEPNGGVKKSVQLKSNGNFNYYISGDDSWNYTRIF